MNEAEYYLLNGSREEGPWTLNQVQEFLRVKAVTLETLYAKPGMCEWKPLASLFGTASPAAPSVKQDISRRKKPADGVVDASSIVRQVARDIEAGLLDDDQKLAEMLKKKDRSVLEAVHGKAATADFLAGKISARDLMRQGVTKLSPDELSELRSIFEKALR